MRSAGGHFDIDKQANTFTTFGDFDVAVGNLVCGTQEQIYTAIRNMLDKVFVRTAESRTGSYSWFPYNWRFE